MDHIKFLSHMLLDISDSRLIVKITADILILIILLWTVVDTLEKYLFFNYYNIIQLSNYLEFKTLKFKLLLEFFNKKPYKIKMYV